MFNSKVMRIVIYLMMIVFSIFIGPSAWATHIPNSEILVFGEIGWGMPDYGDPAYTLDENIPRYWDSWDLTYMGETYYLSYKFSVPYSISQIDFYSLPDHYPHYFMGELDIQISQNSTDGLDGDWTTVDHINGDFIPGDTYFSRYPDIQYTSWVRLKMEYQGRGAWGSSPAFYLNEIDFYGNSVPATITVVSPNGGEELFGGGNFEITWSSEGVIGFVKIEYSINNGTDWIEIIDSTENDGSYNWNVPNNPSDQCLVKISDIDDDPYDVNESVFSILPLFSDVPSGYWAEQAIYKIYNAGITKGCSQSPLMYCPENTVTRTQMAVFLGRAIHGSSFTPPAAIGRFDDVPTSYWAADWIEQFYRDGITSGCSIDPPLYCPYNPVTRAQMAIFLLRSKHGSSYTPPSASGIFSDVPVTYWAADWIEQLYNEGITTGCGTNPLQYCPNIGVNRAQMAVFIMRTFGL